MPPKAPVRSGSKGPKAAVKPKKLTAQQIATEEATAGAQKLFKHHEIARAESEHVDKNQRDRALLDVTLEKERLRADRIVFAGVQKNFFDEERLAFQEYAKHQGWARVPAASRLPDVDSERDINTFLSVWQDRLREFEEFRAESLVVVSTATHAGCGGPAPVHDKYFMRGEQGMPVSQHRRLIDGQMELCMQAYKLSRALLLARDQCGVRGDTKGPDFYNESLRKVNQQILAAVDFATVNAVMHYDIVLDESDVDKETLTRAVPVEQPIFKYGLWIKVKEITRSFTTLVFPGIEVRLDPKSAALPRLPKALGLSKENVAVRAVQLAFDPFAGHNARGKEHYALDCTIKVDLITFDHRPHDCGTWQLRTETSHSRVLQCEEYPPRTAEARTEDPVFRLSFDVPQTLVIRQPSLLVGKWAAATEEWEPCSHLIFGAALGGGASSRAESAPRRGTFSTGELAHFAVLQEKVFDAPYERWSIRPISYDQVVVTLEGRRRGENSDRVFRLLVENTQCRLLSPDDSELVSLRNNWTDPMTLFRLLGQAGFNFILHDDDGKYLNNVRPKSAALEAKAYADIAQYSPFYGVASTRHNKFGEDPDMALFRLAKQARGVDNEHNPYDITEPRTEEWHHLRYHLQSCVLSAYTDDQDRPNLNVLPGHESHFNLYSLLVPVDGEDAIRTQLVNTNYLLRRCIEQILHITRPLSWG